MVAKLVLDPLPIDTPRVLFDVTRLLRRQAQPVATGVDRIDLAIALELRARFGETCGFVSATVAGPALPPPALIGAALEALEARWGGTDVAPPHAAQTLAALARGLGRRPDPRALAETTYVVASHSGLAQRRNALHGLDPEGRMRRLAYLHDIIPLEYPEYQRPASAATFRAWLAQLAAKPLDVAVNSADTGRRLAAYAQREGWLVRRIYVATPRTVLAPLEAAAPKGAAAAILADPSPFFLCVGTIEPRKNHLLLLHLWRALAAERPAPRLVIAGRRGWENEMVLDMLDRCPAVRKHVVECAGLRDPDIAALMRRTRALLMPSFAEGLGIPAMEAACLGAPAILSDLPALREAAGPDALFLDPLDGPAWRRAILDAAQ